MTWSCGRLGISWFEGDGGADDLGAALGRLVADPALRARWGGAGRKRALAQFDEDMVIARQLQRLGLAALH